MKAKHIFLFLFLISSRFIESCGQRWLMVFRINVEYRDKRSFDKDFDERARNK